MSVEIGFCPHVPFGMNEMEENVEPVVPSYTKINTQNELLMNSLMEFYKNPENMERMLKIINGESTISLRIVDWFVTNYAKKYYTIYNLDLADSHRFKVYNDYKLKLKAYSKKRFDPFCRWERTMIPLKDDKYIETTIGQLNFFKWAIENKVIDYIQDNYKCIEDDMNQRNTTSKRKSNSGRSNISVSSTISTETNTSIESFAEEDYNGDVENNEDVFLFQQKNGNGTNSKTRKKREELSVSACKCIKKENVNVVVKFG